MKGFEMQYIKQGENLILVIEGIVHSISKTHFNYSKILKAIEEKNFNLISSFLDIREYIKDYSNGLIEFANEEIFYQKRKLDNSLTKRMISMLKEGFDVLPLVNFMKNLMNNPSSRSVNELYGFLEVNNLPITTDGHFLAYKKVSNDFKDIHSGTVLNMPFELLTDEQKKSMPMICGKVGEVTVDYNVLGQLFVEMPRNAVDDERNNLCSSGLHFCSIDYLCHFSGSKIVVLKINPADVVSIPSDYNNSKGRCSKYIVLEELKVTPESAFTKVVQDTSNTEEYLEDEIEDDY